MASRQDEKQRRREERERREQAEASRAATGRRVRLIGGSAVAVGLIAAVVVAIGLAGDGGTSGAGPQRKAASVSPIPAQRSSDFDVALKSAGCVARKYPSEGRTHLPSDTASNNSYKTNPPSSGNHRPTPAEDGSYAPGNEPAKENAVHALEHGRIEIQYRPGTPAARVAQLQTLFNERLKGVAGYHQLLFQNNTNMAADVSAVAWTQIMRCGTFNNKVFDALRVFRTRFVDKGPELIP